MRRATSSTPAIVASAAAKPSRRLDQRRGAIFSSVVLRVAAQVCRQRARGAQAGVDALRSIGRRYSRRAGANRQSSCWLVLRTGQSDDAKDGRAGRTPAAADRAGDRGLLPCIHVDDAVARRCARSRHRAACGSSTISWSRVSGIVSAIAGAAARRDHSQPSWLLRLLSPMAALLTIGRCRTPGRAELRWAPAFPTLREGLPASCSRHTGTWP